MSSALIHPALHEAVHGSNAGRLVAALSQSIRPEELEVTWPNVDADSI